MVHGQLGVAQLKRKLGIGDGNLDVGPRVSLVRLEPPYERVYRFGRSKQSDECADLVRIGMFNMGGGYRDFPVNSMLCDTF